MTFRRAFALLAVACLVITGCARGTALRPTSVPKPRPAAPSISTSATGPAPVGPPAGAAALLAAVRPLRSTTAELTLTQYSQRLTVQLDGAARKAHVSSSIVEMITIGPQTWFRTWVGSWINGPGGGAVHWMRVDMARVTKPNGLPLNLNSDTDLLGMPSLVAGVTAAHWEDPRHVSGTVDVTRTNGLCGMLEDALQIIRTKLGIAIPFTANLDQQGRLADLVFGAGAGSAVPVAELKITGYGSPQTVTAPGAADVVPMPEQMYFQINSVQS